MIQKVKKPKDNRLVKLDRRRFPKLWTTKEGEKILITKMGTGHIINCLRLFKRKGFVSRETLTFYLCGPQPMGDFAQMAYEEEQAYIFESPHSSFIDAFEWELQKRGMESEEIEETVGDGGKQKVMGDDFLF